MNQFVYILLGLIIIFMWNPPIDPINLINSTIEVKMRRL